MSLRAKPGEGHTAVDSIRTEQPPDPGPCAGWVEDQDLLIVTDPHLVV
jgi:hypothetical protein